MGCLGVMAAVVGIGLFTGAADEDFIRLAVETPAPTPFSLVRYEVVRRGRATTAVHRRGLPGYDEPLHGMGLLVREEAEAVWRLLREVDALSLPDRAPPTGDAREGRGMGLTWSVELSLGGKSHRFRVHDPINAPDRRYHRLVETVRLAVHRAAGDQPFRNVFFPSDTMGWVGVYSIPVARVFVDGFDTKLQTPVYGYELDAGAHEVHLVTPDGRYDRTYQVKVEPRGTTHLRVDLR